MVLIEVKSLLLMDIAEVISLIRKYCKTRDESILEKLKPVIDKCKLNLDVICRTVEKEGTHYYKKLANVLRLCL